MTITTVGWAGTVNEAQFAELMALAPGDSVRSLSEWQVTQGVGRQVSVSAGKAYAKGLLSTSTAAELVTLATPTNGQWFAIVRRLNWVGKTCTIVAVPHTTTSTTTPTAPPSTFPTLNSTPGVSYDHVLAWAWVRSSDTSMVLFDMRQLPVGDVRRRVSRQASLPSPTGLSSFLKFEVDDIPGFVFTPNGSAWRVSGIAQFADAAARAAAITTPLAGMLVRIGASTFERYTGTAWIGSLDDTGWVDIVLTGGATVADGLTPRIRRLNGVTYLTGRMTAAGGASFVLSPENRPSQSTRFPVAVGSSGVSMAHLVVNVDGNVFAAASTVVNLSGVSWVSVP